ncbi:MAG: hypothetical protein HY696_06320 [Deltaproteobacteria bacterium]|nr:hypothetical protein [Deltaproteobacteria bacterium]
MIHRKQRLPASWQRPRPPLDRSLSVVQRTHARRGQRNGDAFRAKDAPASPRLNLFVPWCGRRLGVPLLTLLLVAGCNKPTEQQAFDERVTAFYDAQQPIHAAWAAIQDGTAHLRTGEWSAAASAYARARHLAREARETANAILDKGHSLSSDQDERDAETRAKANAWLVERQAGRLVRDAGLLQGYTWLAAAQRGALTNSIVQTAWYYQMAALAFRATAQDLALPTITSEETSPAIARLLAAYTALPHSHGSDSADPFVTEFKHYIRDERLHALSPVAYVEDTLTRALLPHLSDDSDLGIRASVLQPFFRRLDLMLVEGLVDPAAILKQEARQ